MRWLADIWKNTAPRAPADAERSLARRVEDALGAVGLGVLAVLPAVEAVSRAVAGRSLYASAEWVQHAVLWLALIGGMITTREKRHLALASAPDRSRGLAETITGSLAAAICTALAMASLSFALLGFDPARRIGVVPIRAVVAIMPIGFAVIAARFVTGLSEARARPWVAGAAVLVGLGLAWQPLLSVARALSIDAVWIERVEAAAALWLAPVLQAASLPLIVLLIGAAFAGLPLFVVLGGVALLLFLRSAGALEVIPNEAYSLLTGPLIPAIPLFTLTGFILSEGRAADRLVELLRQWLGWLKGGPVVISIVVCAFFTTFTGGSGVTILALGGLLAAILLKSGYPKRFATGLLTASGSIGLLFPPSLAVIMYGVTALISIKDLFLGGLLPGLLLVVTLILASLLLALQVPHERVPFRPREAMRSLAGSLWEILLPLMILASYFSGFATLVETAALSVAYALLVTVVVRRDIRWRELPAILAKCLPVVGGVFAILTVAKGLSFYVVDAQIPMRLTEAVQAVVRSPLVFLLLLNLGLFVTGAFMDIFSAILVVAPLVIPLGAAYGVHPVHLGMIFLANLEAGYLTPPVGLNLFLASYRFEEPLGRIYSAIVPFLLVRIAAVLIITYVPWLSTGIVGLLGG